MESIFLRNDPKRSVRNLYFAVSTNEYKLESEIYGFIAALNWQQ